ncbi:hypothetical protein PHJA_000680200 [Phtheirospermum japonicum]|uniref:Uncharacterized protein n=1 Tax=Phtheirospermum japonicum TaxID=374723 RepID=A0A830BND1_9LAMI|nr:hypothetical protein PHJA_000680200 [Phtheirospermum japonicum]
MGTGRSTKPLHNFTMPCELRWGSQKHLRCMKVNSAGQISPLRRHNPYTADQRNRRNSVYQRRTDIGGKGGRERGSYLELLHGSHNSSRSPPPAAPGGGGRLSDVDDGIAAMREKLMLDFQTTTDRMKDAIFGDRIEKIEVSGTPPPPAAAAEDEIHMPWNLRTRRTACKTPSSRFVSSLNGDEAAAVGGGENDGVDGMKGLMAEALKPDSVFPQTRAAGSDKSIRLRSGGSAAAIGEKRGRPKFAVALSKSEIEEDFFGMTGHRPARRAKKRARNVQSQLDILFPGLWLKEVTPHMYRVSEATP